MDCISPYHGSLDCHVNTTVLAMMGLLGLERRVLIRHNPSRVILFLKAQQMAEKGCFVYVAIVINITTNTLTVKLGLVVREFSYVFLEVMPDMIPNKHIILVLIW